MRRGGPVPCRALAKLSGRIASLGLLRECVVSRFLVSVPYFYMRKSQSRIELPTDETHIHYDSARNTGARDPYRNRALRHVFIEVGDRIWRTLPEIEFAKMRNDLHVWARGAAAPAIAP